MLRVERRTPKFRRTAARSSKETQKVGGRLDRAGLFGLVRGRNQAEVGTSAHNGPNKYVAETNA